MRVNLNESLIQSSLDPDERPGGKYQSEKKESGAEQARPEALLLVDESELPKVEEQKKEESVAQTPVPQESKESEEDKINENYGDDDKDEDYDEKFDSPSPAKAATKAADLEEVKKSPELE